MKTLIIGGAASGKSQLAEDAALRRDGLRYYIATMEPFGSEAAARIEKHHAMRAQKGFTTFERYTNLAGLRLPAHGTVLLECITNLVANEMFSPDGAASSAPEGTAEPAVIGAVLRGIDALTEQAQHVIIVSGDVFADGQRYGEGTEAYMRSLAAVNRALAAGCDTVIEAVCGIAVYVKGGNP